MSALQLLQQMGSSPGKSVSFRTNAADTSGLATVTFTAQDIGVTGGNRYVIVAAGATFGTGNAVSSCTIGGVTATKIIELTTTVTATILIALVPTGSTADVVITYNGTTSRVLIGVWAAYGLAGTTAVDSKSSTADPGTNTLSTVAGGFCISMGATNSTTSVSWTNVTERYDFSSGGVTSSGADAATTGANISPSGDYAAPGTVQKAVFATW